MLKVIGNPIMYEDFKCGCFEADHWCRFGEAVNTLNKVVKLIDPITALDYPDVMEAQRFLDDFRELLQEP